MNTNFWDSLRLGFAQLRVDCAINPPLNPVGRLIAIWTSLPEPASWRLSHWDKKDGSGVTQRFKWHAQSAAARMGFAQGGDDAVSFWLDQIRRDAPESHVRRLLIEGEGAPQLYSFELLDICGLSADYCRKCEADEARSGMASVETPRNESPRQNIPHGSIRAGRRERPQIEKFANDAFSVARDRIQADFAQKLNRLPTLVRRTGNRGAYLPARIEFEKERLRTLILARADAWLEAFELFNVPADAKAEKDLQTCAREMTAGSIAAIRGDLRLRAGKLRIPDEGQGIPWRLEIERSLNSVLKEGVLRLRRQQITSKNSEGPPEPAEVRADAAPKRPGTAVPNSNQASLKPTFPNRASWLKERLRERSWNKHDLARQRGPDHKTAQKVIDGLSVREDVLEKLAMALSKKGSRVTVLNIPQD